jgi:hypothetical protein
MLTSCHPALLPSPTPTPTATSAAATTTTITLQLPWPPCYSSNLTSCLAPGPLHWLLPLPKIHPSYISVKCYLFGKTFPDHLCKAVALQSNSCHCPLALLCFLSSTNLPLPDTRTNHQAFSALSSPTISSQSVPAVPCCLAQCLHLVVSLGNWHPVCLTQESAARCEGTDCGPPVVHVPLLGTSPASGCPSLCPYSGLRELVPCFLC